MLGVPSWSKGRSLHPIPSSDVEGSLRDPRSDWDSGSLHLVEILRVTVTVPWVVNQDPSKVVGP